MYKRGTCLVIECNVNSAEECILRNKSPLHSSNLLTCLWPSYTHGELVFVIAKQTGTVSGNHLHRLCINPGRYVQSCTARSLPDTSAARPGLYRLCLKKGVTYSFFRLDALAKAVSVIATATWLAGWLGVCHSRYCIKTAKPSGKLFGPSGRPII